MLRSEGAGIVVTDLVWIDCIRSKRFALKLIDLSEFSLPWNLTALLVGMKIVHLLWINLELRGQSRQECLVKDKLWSS